MIGYITKIINRWDLHVWNIYSFHQIFETHFNVDYIFVIIDNTRGQYNNSL